MGILDYIFKSSDRFKARGKVDVLEDMLCAGAGPASANQSDEF